MSLSVRKEWIRQELHLYCVFLCIHALLIEKGICDCRNVFVRFPCVYLCLSSGDLFISFGESFRFLFLFCVIRTSVSNIKNISFSLTFIISLIAMSGFFYSFYEHMQEHGHNWRASLDLWSAECRGILQRQYMTGLKKRTQKHSVCTTME